MGDDFVGIEPIQSGRHNRPAEARRRVLGELEAVINEFAARREPAAFPNLARDDVARGLAQRIAEPVSLDQGAATLSGPAAFMFCVLNDAPELYVRYVIDLHERGRALLGSLTIMPSKACRDAAPDPAKIAPVDWIALASLRDGETAIADYDAANDTSVPATPPAALARWFAAAGYHHIRNDTNLFFPKGRRELAEGGTLFDQGRRICLFVSGDMLIGDGQTQRSVRPNQWVVLAAPIMLMPQDDGVAIVVYEWGSIRRAPPFGRLRLDRFCRNFYGFVAAIYQPPALASDSTAR
jgi:hypothetical protein